MDIEPTGDRIVSEPLRSQDGAGRRPILLTARQLAEQLGVSSETVLRWTRAGALPGFRLPGGAGVSVFELAKIMGTSVLMIERSYGALLDGAGAGIAAQLDAYHERVRTAAESADAFGPSLGH